MLLRRLNYPFTTGLILRRTYPELYKSHIIKLFEEYPQTRHWWREQPKEMTFPNGSRLFFGSAEHEKDMANFYSAEFADIMIDEAQEFSQRELEQLTGSLRCTSNADIVPKMIYTFMPGLTESGLPPKGLSYLKRVFVDKKLEAEEKKQNWAFIQAFSWDNIEWARTALTADGISDEEFYSWPEQARREYFLERTTFGATLQAITDRNLRDAWLYGKWDVFEGQYFPNFARERHVRPHAEVLAMLKPWYTYWISGDWGYDHPHSIYLNAMDEHKRVMTFGEIWGRKVGETELGKEISKRCAGFKFRSFTFSWDAGKLSTRSTPKFPKSISQLISDALTPGIPKPQPADSSPGSRIARARLTSQVLDADSVIISDQCERLIECLPTLVRNPENTEDVLKVDFSENNIGDDPYDGWSMGLQHMLGSPAKPDSVQLGERFQEIRKSFSVRPEGPTSPNAANVDPFAAFGGSKA